MNKLPVFEDFIPLGFASNRSSSFSIGNTPTIRTGYNMDPIVGPVIKLGNAIIEQAKLYESDDDPAHKAESYIAEAKKCINETINSVCETYSLDEGVMSDLHMTAKQVANVDEFVKQFFKKHGNKVKQNSGSVEWVKSLYYDTVKESTELYNLDEADEYEYDPNEHADRLKRREEQNIQRYRAAQDRGDNYAIALYELRIKLDKIDFEKLKVLAAIDDLKEKFGKKDN